ncbi:hypothetical protein UFOVP736_32 [uncultured Caudovirales phage]|uniref:Uncharacterized protein n=1 Tax=uncultured Caudovirales phage TaxID=2100421 RepID=A0A6J5NH56_9CAUD|nr:hypothetical protein UFOVP705_49 [uncultured Caudovirales phage]CAB5224103.1 hypothetical protein UFOVP736_32 [uncultured Caudovirales phage]
MSAHGAAKNVMGVCRIGVDDIHLLPAWVRHHRGPFCEWIGVVLFVRPADDEAMLRDVCEHLKVDEIGVVRGKDFSNTATMTMVDEVAARRTADVLLHCDSDEFVTGSPYDYRRDVARARAGKGVTVWMVDRLAGYKELYDVMGCGSYEELCAVAPRRGMITRDIQGAAYTKCYLHPQGKLAGLHQSRKRPEVAGACALDHFKWRVEYLPKAKRRLEELRRQGKAWWPEIARMIDYYEG